MSVQASLSSNRRRLRVAGFQGLTFAVLYQVGNSTLASLPGAPGGDEVDDDVARYFFDNSGGVLTSAALVAVSAACLVWFVYSFRDALVLIEPSRAAMPGEVIAGAGVAAASFVLCAGFVLISAAERSSREVLPSDTARTFWDLSNSLGLLFIVPAAAFTAAVALVARRVPDLPRWLHLTGAPLVVLLLIPVVAWLSIKVWCIWLMALSISLLRARHWPTAKSSTVVVKN